MSVRFEVGLSQQFTASHVMPGMEGPEGELHFHDYRLEVVVSRPELDEHDMVCDLDLLERALKNVVAVVEGQNLELIKPADAGAVTVEVLARWVHGELAKLLGDSGVESLGVRAWESPVAFGGYEASVARSSP